MIWVPRASFCLAAKKANQNSEPGTGKGLGEKGMWQDKCSSNIENHVLYYLTTDRMSVASAMIIQEIQFIPRSLSIMFISNSQQKEVRVKSLHPCNSRSLQLC